MANQRLGELRQRIDEINLQILELLNERIEVVQQIGIEKQKTGMKVHDSVREKEIIEELVKKNQGLMTDEMVNQIFQEIFKMSVKFQEKQNIK